MPPVLLLFVWFFFFFFGNFNKNYNVFSAIEKRKEKKMLQRGEENIEMVLWYGLNDLTANQKLLRFNQSFNKIVKNKSTRTHPNPEIRVSRFRETKWRLKWNAKAKTNKEAITMLRRTFSFPFKEFPGTRTRQQRTVFSLPRHPLLHPPPLLYSILFLF